MVSCLLAPAHHSLLIHTAALFPSLYSSRRTSIRIKLALQIWALLRRPQSASLFGPCPTVSSPPRFLLCPISISLPFPGQGIGRVESGPINPPALEESGASMKKTHRLVRVCKDTEGLSATDSKSSLSEREQSWARLALLKFSLEPLKCLSQ